MSLTNAPRPTPDFDVVLHSGEYLRVSEPFSDAGYGPVRHFLEYHQAYLFAEALAFEGALGDIDVMVPVPGTEVTAANSNGFPVVMGTIPAWKRVDLDQRIVHKDRVG